MAATIFQKNIEKLDFSFKEGKAESGVLFTKASQNQSSLTPQEIFSLELAREKFGADAVYFRWFNDSREAVAQIYLYDFTAALVTDERRKEIHRKVWSGCLVPIYIIIEENQVKIFDARRNVEQSDDYAPELIKLTGEAISSFSASSFDDGLFWEEKEYKDDFQYGTSAYRDLISGLKNVYKDFQKKTSLDSHVALKLLVQCLLIKYLEERDEQSETGYFAATYFKRNFSCNNFCEVIRKRQLLKLLDQLAKDFNGRIFDWDNETETAEREVIETTDLNMLANYLDGHRDGQQFVLWRLYSFSHLPVELISSVYEELLTNSKDIVYTPEMVVSLLVDECMPLKNPQPDFKLIDVSCGSGIFLVKAYKRIIQWWRYQQWLDTGELIKPDLSTLKKLLKKSVYGIDIQQDAIRLSVFSLALALLDEVDLSPPVWQNLKFPDLGEKNIVTADFFKYITGNYVGNFDLVIGNPPFNPYKKGQSNGDYIKEIKEEYGYESEVIIPDNNPALHFLIKAKGLIKKDGLLCMIQPSGPLLYQKSKSFRKYLFNHYNLLQVIDFTKLADILWGIKNVATAAVFFQNSDSDNAAIMHVVASRTSSNKKRLFFEFDYYDFHWVSKDEAINSTFLWKANMFGGGRLGMLIERLSILPTLGQYLKAKTNRSTNKWYVSEGYTKRKTDEWFLENYDKEVLDKKFSAPYLTGSISFDPKDFTESGISRTYTLAQKYFYRRVKAENFKGPLLLIKENIGKKSIPLYYSDSDITYKNEVIGIHAPKCDLPDLKRIEDTFRDNQLFRFYLLLTSGRAGIIRSQSTLYKKDILLLPYLEDRIVISEAELILMDDVLNYYLKSVKGSLEKIASLKTVEDYSKVFCHALNSIYQTNGKKFCLFKILDAGKYYALHFQYTHATHQPVTENVAGLEQYIAAHIPLNKENPLSIISSAF